MRVILTGGYGKLGLAVTEHLREAGHEVVVFDRVSPRQPGSLLVELSDYGEVLEGMLGIVAQTGRIDGIVHLAAIPAPGITPEPTTFRNNILATYNVLQTARRVGVKRVVTASSETVLGLPFEIEPPYLPVNEEYLARPESAYSLSKHLEETMAVQFARWDPELSITAIRFSNVISPEDYALFPSFQSDPGTRRFNLWGYIDARDGGQAVRLALETREPGYECVIVASDDTVMERPSIELAREVFPNVPLTHELRDRETLLSIDKAKKLLGYRPQHHWQDEVRRAADADNTRPRGS